MKYIILLGIFALSLFGCSKSNDSTGPNPDTENVYIVGYENAPNSIAKSWNNGVSVTLSGTNTGMARSISVSGNDIYIAGHEFNNGHAVAKLWKNGIATSLSTGTYYSDAT